MAEAPDSSSDPLAGVRVIDLTRVVAGPYVGRILADLGADVIKIEPPEGDLSRQIAPKHDRGMSALFTFANAGKRSISLDLKQAGAREVVLDLVRSGDVVIENFRPGVVDRLGLGWEAVRAANPRAVLLSINGFGAASQWAGRRAFAPILHAITGIMHDQSEYSGQPVAQRNEAHADTVSALHGAVSVLAALRVVEATGRGQRIEVPMFDAVLTSYSEALNALLDPPDDRIMNPVFDAGPHGVVAIAGPVQHVWRAIAGAHPELVDPTPAGASLESKTRLRHDALEHFLAKQESLEVILEKLDSAGLAAAPVVSLREALTGPLARERSLLTPVDDRRGGTRPVVRPAARFSDSTHRVRGRAPRRGEHNAEVLRELAGYDEARIAALLDAGVLAAASEAEER